MTTIDIIKNRWLHATLCLPLFTAFLCAYSARAELPPPPELTMAQRLSGSSYVVVGKLIQKKTIDVRLIKTGHTSKVHVLEIAVERFIFPEGCEAPKTYFVDLTLTTLGKDIEQSIAKSSRAIVFLGEPYLKPLRDPKIYDWPRVYRSQFPLPLEKEDEIKSAIPRELERLKRGGYTRKCPEEISQFTKE